MLSVISSHALYGISGCIIQVEVDIRFGLPGIDIVGLPDSAVREARERVRVAIRNSGFEFPAQRILVSLAPAGIKKGGSSFDLPIALGILAASGQIALPEPEPSEKILVLGELYLSGRVGPAHGVLPAIEAGLKDGHAIFLVPQENLHEARILGNGRVYAVTDLGQAAVLVTSNFTAGVHDVAVPSAAHAVNPHPCGDFSDIRAHHMLKRAIEIAVAGCHHIILFGPPGSGKTMAARRIPSIMPDLSQEEALEVTRIYSAAGLLSPGESLVTTPPFRIPHHTASGEGITGGGRWCSPGEVTLAHRGILFLDEAPEFRKNLLQSLREPVEQEEVTVVRAEQKVTFPASFQLIMTANPCPCGMLGKNNSMCMCSQEDVAQYWKKLGGALLDRVDIRVPVKPVSGSQITGEAGETSLEIRKRILVARKIQEKRYAGFSFSRNGRISPGFMERFCALGDPEKRLLHEAVDKLKLSSRAIHSIMKIARTIADLGLKPEIERVHLLEAISHRRYGEENLFWN